jgi:hypothetical protein
LEILCHRSETGLLEISSPRDSGQFYLKDGKLIDAVLNNAGGTEAVRCAERLTDGSFKFNAVHPAEYARLVWQNSLMHEQLSDRSNSLRSVIALGVRELLTNVAIGSRNLFQTLKSMREAVFVEATRSFEGKKRVAQITSAALQKSISKRLTNLLVWLKRVNDRLFKSISDLKHRQMVRLSTHSKELTSRLNAQTLHLNGFILILIGTLAATLIIKGRWFEEVTGKNQTPQAGQEIATADSTLSKSEQPMAPVKPAQTRPTEIQRAAEKEGPSRFVSENPKQSDKNKRSKTSDSKRQTSPAFTSSLASSTESQQRSSNSAQTVSVLVQIEGGHVSNASVIEPRPGLEKYEAAALRVARQRRYSTSNKRFDVLTVRIKN